MIFAFWTPQLVAARPAAKRGHAPARRDSAVLNEYGKYSRHRDKGYGYPATSGLTFKIIQRSAESLDERPIPIELNFEFEEYSDHHQAFMGLGQVRQADRGASE